MGRRQQPFPSGCRQRDRRSRSGRRDHVEARSGTQAPGGIERPLCRTRRPSLIWTTKQAGGRRAVVRSPRGAPPPRSAIRMHARPLRSSSANRSGGTPSVVRKRRRGRRSGPSAKAGRESADDVGRGAAGARTTVGGPPRRTGRDRETGPGRRRAVGERKAKAGAALRRARD